MTQYDEFLERVTELRAAAEKLMQPPTAAESREEVVDSDGGKAKVSGVVKARYADIVDARMKAMALPPQLLRASIRDQLEYGSKHGAGIPFDQWATDDIANKLAASQIFTRLLDTAGGAALIRQDLEPLIYAQFVRRFPAYARIDKVPANGLVHTFQRVDSRPTPSYIGETQAVPDSQGTYTRETSNIAILAVRVGTSLKETLAVPAGGMAWNAEQFEINFGIEGLAARTQQTILQGNASAPGGGADNDGPFDANAFNGLRRTIPGANIQALGADTILEALNKTDNLITNRGGRASVIYIHATDNVRMANELQPFRRFVDSERVDIVPGLPRVLGIYLSGSGEVPLVPVPGADWAAYAVGGPSLRDAFVLDESMVAVPYLGSESPTVFELPFGVTGSLTKLYLLVYMSGLAVRIPNFCAKLRIPV